MVLTDIMLKQDLSPLLQSSSSSDVHKWHLQTGQLSESHPNCKPVQPSCGLP